MNKPVDVYTLSLVPLLPLKAVSEFVGLPLSTVQTWLSRGHFPLRFSARKGVKGSDIYMAPIEAALFRVAADLSRMGIAPSITGGFTDEVIAAIGRELMFYPGDVWSHARHDIIASRPLYLCFWGDDESGDLVCSMLTPESWNNDQEAMIRIFIPAVAKQLIEFCVNYETKTNPTEGK